MKRNRLNKEQQKELNRALLDMNDPFAFEKYCGACDNFNTDNCPFKNKVADDTEWSLIGCTNFYD